MATTGGKFPYVVILKNTAVRPVNLLGILLNAASCVFFTREFLMERTIDIFLLAGLSLILGILVWNQFKVKRGNKVFYDRAYLVTALLWLKMPFLQWLFVPFVLLALLEHHVKFPLEIGFSETHIVFNSFFRKKYQWSDFSNILLKDGLLTMDFLNNRLLQRAIEDDEEEDDASEEEFNQFCREQLKKNIP